MERKLTTILSADVVGYSALMERDEAGTHERLKSGRKDLFEPEIARHHGRVFKLMGDGLLAEFGSVVDAVECAVSLQRGLAERNANVADDQRIEVRIGINLGEVIVEGEDRFGEGVNIAARLQQLAAPGGICVSSKVAKEVEKKLAFGFESMGAQKVKNIAEPIQAFRVQLDGVPIKRLAPILPIQALPWAVAVAALLLLAAGAWFALWRPAPEAVVTTERTVTDAKPSLVVLPFANLSDDKEQGYLADGITEDLTTELAQLPGLFVISRNAAFTYKGRAMQPAQIAKELGVRFIIEGSTRRAADDMRINAQLIDAQSGGHVWAERFDGKWADVFALQDRIVGQIAAALKLRLHLAPETKLRPVPKKPVTPDATIKSAAKLAPLVTPEPNEGTGNGPAEIKPGEKADDDVQVALAKEAELESGEGADEPLFSITENAEPAQPDSAGRADDGLVIRGTEIAEPVQSLSSDRAGGTNSPAAYDAYLRALQFQDSDSPDDWKKSIASLRQALAIDPEFGRAAAKLAWIFQSAQALEPKLKALGMTGDEARARRQVNLIKAARNPSAPFYQMLAEHLIFQQKSGEAIAAAQKSIALDPSDPWGYEAMSWALTLNGRPQEGRDYVNAAQRVDPKWTARRYLLGGLAEFSMGRFEEAAALLEKLDPKRGVTSLWDHWGNDNGLRLLVSTYGHLGRIADADAVKEKLKPNMAVAEDREFTGLLTVSGFPFSNFANTERLLEGLGKAGVPELPSGLDPKSAERLTGAEIRPLIFGQVVEGREIETGAAYWRKTALDGTTEVKVGTWSDIGVTTVEGNLLCSWVSTSIRSCGAVFRHPGGTSENKNEYRLINPRNSREFSVVK